MAEGEDAKKVYILTCGNCGFKGNAHEMEVHAAILHYPCAAPDCAACAEKYHGLGSRE